MIEAQIKAFLDHYFAQILGITGGSGITVVVDPDTGDITLSVDTTGDWLGTLNGSTLAQILSDAETTAAALDTALEASLKAFVAATYLPLAGGTVTGATIFQDLVTIDTLRLSDTVWDDIKINGLGVRLGSVNPPGWTQFRDDGAGSSGTYLYGFDDAAEEQVFFEIQIPHKYKQGTDLKFHIHWSTTTGNAGDCVWALEYSVVHIDGVFPETSTISAACTASGVAYTHEIHDVGTIDGTGLKESSVLVGRLYRDATAVADTLTGDALLVSADFHYELEKMGTDNELPV